MGQRRARVGVGAAQRRRAAAREQVEQAAEVALQGVLDGPPADRLEIAEDAEHGRLGRTRGPCGRGGQALDFHGCGVGRGQMKRYLVRWMCCTLK